jgi:acetyl-CoA carboxylase biotin carboxyl carrier protein
MDLKDIQTLIKFVASQRVDEVMIEQDNFKITVKKNPGVAPVQQTVAAYMPTQVQTPPPPTPTTTEVISPSVPAETMETSVSSDHLMTIKSPMIGTFYRSSKPGSPAFVNVGDDIKSGKVICIIEAMKLFNEIESEVSGRIVKILVDNNSPVEYDQPLFLVEPA